MKGKNTEKFKKCLEKQFFRQAVFIQHVTRVLDAESVLEGSSILFRRQESGELQIPEGLLQNLLTGVGIL